MNTCSAWNRRPAFRARPLTRAQLRDTYEYWSTEHLRLAGVGRTRGWKPTGAGVLGAVHDESARHARPDEPGGCHQLRTQLPTRFRRPGGPEDALTGGQAGSEGTSSTIRTSRTLFTLSSAWRCAAPSIESTPPLWPAVPAAGSLAREPPVADVVGLQQPDGSFAGDEWGEIDTRFTSEPVDTADSCTGPASLIVGCPAYGCWVVWTGLM